MKKNIINIVVAYLVFSQVAVAQQVLTATATLGPGGQVLKVTDVSGEVTTIHAATNAEIQNEYLKVLQKQVMSVVSPAKDNGQVFIPHQAVLLKDGTQEIRWIDPAGKERVVTAIPGESIQQKYWAYLKKEGLPCGCTPPENSAAQPATKTITLSATKPNALDK